MKLILTSSILLFSISSLAQSVRRELTTAEGKILFSYENVLVSSVEKQAENCEYYWFDYAQIQTTKSGFRGFLLHGEYTSFHRNGQLYEQGNFQKGLKIGLWKKWNEEGQLIQTSTWKSGMLHGEVLSYAGDGSLLSVEKYKGGKKNGKCIYYTKDQKQVIKFRNGEEVHVKERREKKVKPKVEPLDEVLPDKPESGKKKKSKPGEVKEQDQ